MPKTYEMNYPEDTNIYPLGVNEIGEITERSNVQNESTTYIDVMHFVKDIFSLLDFSGIITGAKK